MTIRNVRGGIAEEIAIVWREGGGDMSEKEREIAREREREREIRKREG